jgi:acyl-CoA thioesterase FadM
MNPLRFEDEVTVKVRAGFGRRRIQYGFEIRRADTVAATGAITTVCTRANAGTLESIEIPQGLVDRLRGALR